MYFSKKAGNLKILTWENLSTMWESEFFLKKIKSHECVFYHLPTMQKVSDGYLLIISIEIALCINNWLCIQYLVFLKKIWQFILWIFAPIYPYDECHIFQHRFILGVGVLVKGDMLKTFKSNAI